MRLGQWIILLILTGMYGLASAGYYRFVDEEGKVKFTDNLTNVPVEQRSKADEYVEPEDQFVSEEEDEEEPEKENAKEAMKKTEEARPKTAAPDEEVGEKTPEQKLREAGARLREEYQALMKEKKELDRLATIQLTEAQRKALIKKVRDYNSRSEDYEKRRAAFNKEVESYNATIEEEVQEPR